MRMPKVNGDQLAKQIGSDKFFRIIVGLLVLQAAWIALSGGYPMAFDEDFHLGIIKLYAHHLSPFWHGQAAGGGSFGALARDPSYLYHYLLSFPYRLIESITRDLTIQVLILRFLNIGLFAASLPLYKRLLRRLGASQSMTHLALLVFILIPVVPQLAAHINYDNLVIPLTALTLLLTLDLRNKWTARRLDLRLLLALTSLCLLTSLVKYAYLPVFLAIGLYLGYHAVKLYWPPRQMGAALKIAWRQGDYWSLLGLVLLTILSGSLFVERYGINLAHYHKPVVDCGEVLGYDQCQYYGPWIRDYNFKHTKTVSPHSPLVFTQHWLYGMWLRSLFAVGGRSTNYQSRGPLWLPAVSVVVLALASGLAVLAKFKTIWRHYNRPLLSLLALATLLHIGLLWLEEYKLFLQTGQPVAINGRYLLPVLPFLIIISALSLRALIRRRWQLGLSTAAVVCMLWGGGALTYILRSNDSWYWPNATIRSANHAVQRSLGWLTPGDNNPTLFLH